MPYSLGGLRAAAGRPHCLNYDRIPVGGPPPQSAGCLARWRTCCAPSLARLRYPHIINFIRFIFVPGPSQPLSIHKFMFSDIRNPYQADADGRQLLGLVGSGDRRRPEGRRRRHWKLGSPKFMSPKRNWSTDCTLGDTLRENKSNGTHFKGTQHPSAFVNN